MIRFNHGLLIRLSSFPGPTPTLPLVGVLYSTANDPQPQMIPRPQNDPQNGPQMIPRPQVIPKVDRK